LGNLASRVAAMVAKYCDGVLPAPVEEGGAEQALALVLGERAVVADQAIRELRFHDGLAAIKDFVDAVNGYVTEQAPWQVAKDEAAQGRLHTILYTSADALRAIAVLYAAVMPTTATRLWSLLGAEDGLGALSDQPVQDVAAWGQLAPGARLTKGDALFPRLDDPTS
jgi:methionyl-tRNA synthetase